MKKIAYLIFLLLAAGSAGVWWWQSNSYSKEILKLEILAPENVQAGEEFTYIVKWKNNGNVRLENPVLMFEFPKGAIPSNQDRMRVSQELEAIYPGQERTTHFPARLFGKEGEVKEARAELSYSPKDLSASYRSETSTITRISSVPLSFDFDIPSRVEQRQQFEFNLNYFSQSSYPLSDLRVQIEYPEQFEFASASPLPLGTNEWRIGVLNQGDGGRITVRGFLKGGLQDVHIFKASIGSWKEGEFTLLKEIHKGVEIGEPNIALSYRINGSESHIASPGETLRFEVFFRNVGRRNLENLFLAVNLDGRPLNFETITAPRGSFTPGDTGISWDARNVPKLRFLGQQEEGSVEFWVTMQEDWQVFSPQDKDFTLTTRVTLSDTERVFSTKVAGSLKVTQQAIYQDVIIPNSGPVPPQIGSSTTYTIRWEAQSQYTDKEDVKVKARLPRGVEMTGVFVPSDVSLTFDSNSREVVWDIGRIQSGTGTLTDPARVSFQVRLIPREDQGGQIIPLIEEARISGTDTFVNQEVSSTAFAVNTTLPHDPTVASEQGRVQF
ncbi:MAG: hypothetical protein Q8P39_00625 [Candidatus Yanofskybacteria bacterium]|nr:hypothetical protein [Candidatus Yanofskybacteria bacterium]